MELVNQLAGNNENWRTRLGDFFKRLGGKSHESADVHSTQFENFKEIGTVDISDADVNDKNDCLNEVALESQAFLKLGISDGATGIKPTHVKNIALTTATIFHAKLSGIFCKKQGVIKKRIEFEIQKISQLNETYADANERKEILDEHYLLNQKDYSLGLGIAYIIIALLLVAADFPLSSLVAREVFELKGYQDELFGLGIAAMTVFIKIIYDQYLGMSVRAFLLRRRKETLLGKNFPDATEEELRKARSIYNIQLLAKLLILIFLIATIVVVGLLRLENDANMASTGAFLKGTGSTVIIESWYKKVAFIGVTVAFPLIGGVCSSVAFKHITNLYSRRHVRVEMEAIEKEKDVLRDKISELDGEMRSGEVVLNWLGDADKFSAELSTYFSSSYTHGYQEGVHQNTPKDMILAAEHAQSNYLIQQSVQLYTNQSHQNES